MKLRRRVSAVDFTEDMMPSTRRAVFKDVMSLHWFDLLKLGLLLLAAILPVIVMSITADAYEARIYSALADPAADEALFAARADAVSFRNTTALVSIPLYMLFNVVLAGAIRLIRQYAWEEVAFFWGDLGKGIKQNWKQYIAVGLLMGAQNAIGSYLTGYGVINQQKALIIAGGIFRGIAWIIIFPVCAYMLVQISVYGNTFRQNFRVGSALFAKSPVKTIAVLLAVCAVTAISLIPNFICHIAGYAFGALLAPYTMLVWFLFTSAQLDKYINPTHFPELVGRGMRKNDNGQ